METTNNSLTAITELRQINKFKEIVRVQLNTAKVSLGNILITYNIQSVK